MNDDDAAVARNVTLSSEEVKQAARLLGRLLGPPEVVSQREPSARKILLSVAQLSQFVRDSRSEFFAPAMFGEPAWDLVLALYIQEEAGATQTVSSLAKAALTPVSTALRWLDYLEEKNLLARERSERDRRTNVVILTDHGRCALDHYFERILERIALVPHG